MFLSCIQPNRTKQWCVRMFNNMQLDSWHKARDHPWTEQSCKENAVIIDHSKCCFILRWPFAISRRTRLVVLASKEGKLFTWAWEHWLWICIDVLSHKQFSLKAQSNQQQQKCVALVSYPNWCCWQVANHVDIWGKGNRRQLQNRKLL